VVLGQLLRRLHARAGSERTRRAPAAHGRARGGRHGLRERSRGARGRLQQTVLSGVRALPERSRFERGVLEGSGGFRTTSGSFGDPGSFKRISLRPGPEADEGSTAASGFGRFYWLQQQAWEWHEKQLRIIIVVPRVAAAVVPAAKGVGATQV